MKYTIELSGEAKRFLKKIHLSDKQKILAKLKLLSSNPLPNGCIKFKGCEFYRIRQGDYRIIFSINNQKLIILILDIDHRKDIYRQL